MFITRVTLNPERLGTRKALSSPRVIHGMVQKSFPESSDRVLWFLDKNHRDPQLYILSPCKPSVEHIIEQAGRVEDSSSVLSKSYQPVLDATVAGSSFRIKALVNPTVSVAGKRVPISGETSIREWVTQRGEANGYKVIADIEVRNGELLKIKKPEGLITMQTVTFDTRVEVVDEAKFHYMLLNGLGRGKAYGLGLVTIARQ